MGNVSSSSKKRKTKSGKHRKERRGHNVKSDSQTTSQLKSTIPSATLVDIDEDQSSSGDTAVQKIPQHIIDLAGQNILQVNLGTHDDETATDTSSEKLVYVRNSEVNTEAENTEVSEMVEKTETGGDEDQSGAMKKENQRTEEENLFLVSITREDFSISPKINGEEDPDLIRFEDENLLLSPTEMNLDEDQRRAKVPKLTQPSDAEGEAGDIGCESKEQVQPCTAKEDVGGQFEDQSQHNAAKEGVSLELTPTEEPKENEAIESSDAEDPIMTLTRLIGSDVNKSELEEAYQQCGSIDATVSYMQQTCNICTDTYSMTKMVCMLYCECKFCEGCTCEYFKKKIREHNILRLSCPSCGQPDDLENNEEKANDYFSCMQITLRNLLDSETCDLFDKKLLEHSLRKENTFKWCSQCGNGMLIHNVQQRRMTCHYCAKVTCHECQSLWSEVHEGVDCQQYLKLKFNGNQEEPIKQQLEATGIQCPNCKYNFELSKGGCLHFTCSQCDYQFCSGCAMAFRKKQCPQCPNQEKAASLGLHAHHLRNCHYYMRDKGNALLKKLLDIHNVKYKTEATEGSNPVCAYVEETENAMGKLQGHQCGRTVQLGEAGLCRTHYREYLSNLIVRNKIDPIEILDKRELEILLNREGKAAPDFGVCDDETAEKKLRKFISENLPLRK